MSSGASAFWRRLDRPGHDAATIERSGDGWTLSGYAVFLEKGVTGLHYQLEIGRDFGTRSARIEGFRDGVHFAHEVRRSGAWYLDEVLIADLDDLVHLDLGFTPATNFQQLRRAGLKVGDEAEIPAAWFDVGAASLTRLPQRYRRLSEDRYDYSSPTASYSAVLELAPSGFVRVYPGLWEMEGDR